MPSVCVSCGAKFSLGRRFSGKSLCETCEARESANAAAAAAAYESALIAYRIAATRVADGTGSSVHLPALAAGLRPFDVQRVGQEIYKGIIDRAIEDEYLTEDEEHAIDGAAIALGLTNDAQMSVLQPVSNRIVVARMNAGRLPVLSNPSVILKPGEVAHAEVSAQLMKEVVHREMRGGYSGVSFRVAKGVRFHTGGYRGKSVVVGTSREVADSGVLCITSSRLLFKGSRQTVECLYSKLVGLSMFTDGIEVNVTNRQKTSLFRVGDGFLVAAAINAAVQQT